MSPAAFTPAFASRLALRVDVRALLRDIETLDSAPWIQPPNTDSHSSGCDSVTLVSQTASADGRDAPAALSSEQVGSPADWLARCPSLASLLSQWPCPVKSARLLRLAPGAAVREEGGCDLRWSDGVARLHIPLLTNDRTECYVEQTRVEMLAGECWYLDLSRACRVQNLGATTCIHLVLDCAVNAWLESAVRAGFVPQPGNLLQAPLTGAAQFQLFRECVFRDVPLQQALRATKEMDAFLANTVAAGAARGFVFSLDDVRAHCNQARRDWIEQWIM